MAAAAPYLALAGAVFSAIGAIQQGNTAKKIGEHNARIAERSAVAARQQAAADAEAKEREKIQRIGAMRASYGASGQTQSGSALDVLSTNTALLELDKENILYQGRLRAMGYTDEAALERAKGKAAQTQGYVKAGSALLSGGGKFFA